MQHNNEKTELINTSKLPEVQQTYDQIGIANLQRELSIMKNLMEKSQERENFLLKILAEERKSITKSRENRPDFETEGTLRIEKPAFAMTGKEYENQGFHRACIYSALTVSILLSCAVLIVFVFIFLL